MNEYCIYEFSASKISKPQFPLLKIKTKYICAARGQCNSEEKRANQRTNLLRQLIHRN